MAFRFVFMADCQLGCYASFSGLDEDDVATYAARGMQVRVAPTTTSIAWDVQRYERAVALTNTLGADFVVLGGDMVDVADDEEQHAALRRVTAALGVPMRWVPGNHDVARDGDVPTAADLAAYRERFGADHYAFTHDGATVVVIDTPVWVHAEAVPDEHAAQEQALRAALAGSDRTTGPTIVVGHHPLFTARHDEPDDYWNIPTRRRRGLLDLFDRHRVSTYLSGHWHRNGGGRHRNLEVVVSGPVGYPLGDDPSGLRVVDVGPDGVRHHYVPLDPDD